MQRGETTADEADMRLKVGPGSNDDHLVGPANGVSADFALSLEGRLKETTYVSTLKSVLIIKPRRMTPVRTAKMPTQKTRMTCIALALNFILLQMTQIGSARRHVSMTTPTIECVHIIYASLSFDMHWRVGSVGLNRSLAII